MHVNSCASNDSKHSCVLKMCVALPFKNTIWVYTKVLQKINTQNLLLIVKTMVHDTLRWWVRLKTMQLLVKSHELFWQGEKQRQHALYKWFVTRKNSNSSDKQRTKEKNRLFYYTWWSYTEYSLMKISITNLISRLKIENKNCTNYSTDRVHTYDGHKIATIFIYTGIQLKLSDKWIKPRSHRLQFPFSMLRRLKGREQIIYLQQMVACMKYATYTSEAAVLVNRNLSSIFTAGSSKIPQSVYYNRNEIEGRGGIPFICPPGVCQWIGKIE